MPSHHYLIFDLDGTLDDQMPEYTKVFIMVCAEYGLLEEKALAERFNHSAGSPLQQQFLMVFASSGLQPDLEQLKRCTDRFRELVGEPQARPFPGAPDLILSLFRQQRHLYLTTGSKTEEAIRRMDGLGLRPYFDLILGEDKDLQKGAAHLQQFKEHSGDSCFAQRALYLGDGTADMRFARKFGITAVGITTTLPAPKLLEAGASYTIGSLAEFFPLLEKLEKKDT